MLVLQKKLTKKDLKCFNSPFAYGWPCVQIYTVCFEECEYMHIILKYVKVVDFTCALTS